MFILLPELKELKVFVCFLACFLIFLKSPIYFQYEASLKKMKMCIVVLLCARHFIQGSEIIWLHGLDFQTIFFFFKKDICFTFFFFLRNSFIFYFLFIYLFIFGCVGSSFLCEGLL